VNTYSFFGYEFRLPFYDLPLMDFFSRLPMLWKENKILYDNILINQYFNDLDVKFNFELQFRDLATTKTNIRRLAAPFAPSWLKKWKIRRNDSIFYHEITEEMLKDMKKHGLKPKLHGKTYNSLIVQWYIFNQSRALSSSKGTNLKLP
jgi:asparagine synthase (glutamine-hydrolysing)